MRSLTIFLALVCVAGGSPIDFDLCPDEVTEDNNSSTSYDSSGNIPTPAETTAEELLPMTSDTTSATTSDTTSPTTSDTTSPTTSDTTSATTSDTTSPTTSDTTSPTTSDTTSATTSLTTSDTTSLTTSATTSPTTSRTTSDTTTTTSPTTTAWQRPAARIAKVRATAKDNHGYYPPSKIIDGRLSTRMSSWSRDCYHSLTNTDVWAEVRLNDAYQITKVSVLNRGDCCYTRLIGMEVKVCRGAGGGDCTLCGKYNTGPAGRWVDMPCASPILGDTIRFEQDNRQPMQICEMRVTEAGGVTV